MKDIKLSFPYPKTSRHNLSQDVALSLSMGLLTPVRVVEVLPGDTHLIGGSFSLISNPLVKPLLQSVKMRYCRFWVPRRIYHLAQRANNSDFDPRTATVRTGVMSDFVLPAHLSIETSPYRQPADVVQASNFQASSLFDYLGIAPVESNFFKVLGSEPNYGLPNSGQPLYSFTSTDSSSSILRFNAEPYLAYIDICRTYFADSALGSIAWCCAYNPPSGDSPYQDWRCTVVSPLQIVDKYIDSVQNTEGSVVPYSPLSVGPNSDVPFNPFVLTWGKEKKPVQPASFNLASFSLNNFGVSHVGLCVPSNRPDRLSRLFDTRPLTSQNAAVSSDEVTIANLSFLAKLQRYLTRKFFGGSRYTDVMYSVFGQKVPHVDSPVCLDVFDTEIGSQLVASTNASETQNPGVLGGYFSASGYLSTNGKRYKKRYMFNEAGYLIDLVYIMPRVYRSAFYSDFYSVVGAPNLKHMSQGNFIPDMNGIGWQQPSFLSSHLKITAGSEDGEVIGTPLPGFASEASWQQYRTLPDVSRGLLNPNRSASISVLDRASDLTPTVSVNSPIFVFNDRQFGQNVFMTSGSPDSASNLDRCLFQMVYTDFNTFNSVFGFDQLTLDNIYCVFEFAHQAKRQVSKRFTLSF